MIIYLHRGGYVFGSPEQDRALIGRLALATGAEVVGPAYRLAPEAPYPAAVVDTLAVYQAVLNVGGETHRSTGEIETQLSRGRAPMPASEM